MPASDSPCERCNQAPATRSVVVTNEEGDEERLFVCGGCYRGIEYARKQAKWDHDCDEADTRYSSGER